MCKKGRVIDDSALERRRRKREKINCYNQEKWNQKYQVMLNDT
jgi:hypothetical protein